MPHQEVDHSVWGVGGRVGGCVFMRLLSILKRVRQLLGGGLSVCPSPCLWVHSKGSGVGHMTVPFLHYSTMSLLSILLGNPSAKPLAREEVENFMGVHGQADRSLARVIDITSETGVVTVC